MQQIIKSDHIATDVQQAIRNAAHDKLFVLTDDNTHDRCLPLLAQTPQIKEATQIITPAGDENKTAENLYRVWKALTHGGATRHSLLLNLGGGMVTDLGGFAAATFKRGIRYINVPTTLLGAVDAAVGGKTGVNFEGYKNEIGAFHPALAVIIAASFFRTLSREALLSGYAEMIKHALIRSAQEWEAILAYRFDEEDFAALNELVVRSVNVKREIVEQDPHERGIRKALNFGHTVAHAFESLALREGRPIAHGYAVAWGMVAELWLSHRLCGFPKDKLQKTVRFIRQLYGAFFITCNQYDALYEIALHDKKNVGDSVRFALLSDAGQVLIDQTAGKELFFEALDFYRDAVGI